MNKMILATVGLLILTTTAQAEEWRLDGETRRRPYKDAWGNSYSNPSNLYKDTDRDGVINYYDSNDRNPNVSTPRQRNYDPPSYSYPARSYGSGYNGSKRGVNGYRW